MCLLSFVTRYYVLKFGIGFFDLVPMDVWLYVLQSSNVFYFIAIHNAES